MSPTPELTTVFRSADSRAREDAHATFALLREAGLHPVLLDESAPGVMEGSYEVRVPLEESSKAEELLAEADTETAAPVAGDDSEAHDLETVVSTDGITAEMLAIEIRSLLSANGIPAVIVGTTQLPNLGFEVRVARQDVERAQQILAEAQAAGPAAAEEAERATETNLQ
jgi:hypothetical protein